MTLFPAVLAPLPATMLGVSRVLSLLADTLGSPVSNRFSAIR